MRTIRLILALALLTFCLPATPTRAAGVVTICDETHLRAALNGEGTVTFACSGVIDVTSGLYVSGNTTVDGSGQHVTLVASDQEARVFTVPSGTTLNLNHLTLTKSGSAKGGIYSDGYLNVTDCTFVGNSAAAGAGIDSAAGSVSVIRSNFTGNSATFGGAIRVRFITANVTNSAFSGNSATYGGAIAAGGSGTTLNVSGSSFSGNSGDYGGAIHNTDGELNVTNTTFSGNSADYGGGIYNFGSLTLNSSTLSGNSASTADTGGALINWSQATLTNTIMANSPAGGNCAARNAITDGGANLSFPDTSCPGINADPLLGPLQYNGGPTPTLALAAGSPAIDACSASCPANDQRGAPRPFDGDEDGEALCDIGAYEWNQGWLSQVYLPLAVK